MNEENLQKQIDSLRSEIKALRDEKLLKLHTHNGFDSSKIPFSSVTAINRLYSVERGGILDMLSKDEHFYIYADPAEPGSEDLVIDAAAAGKATFIKIGANASEVKISNLTNASASALSGTQRDVEILIGGISYHFTVYPTKA